MDLKNNRRGRISEYAQRFKGAKYFAGQRPWGVPGFFAFPCATQNEIDGSEAETMSKNGVRGVSEGANMPSDPEAIDVYYERKMLYGPAKAANAGGVATSALEMSQNSERLQWPRDEVDRRLHQIMVDIHSKAAEAAVRIGMPGNLMHGANVAGFLKVADAMLAHGVV
jgi:glutamate dehydrogenase (NADP+)